MAKNIINWIVENWKKVLLSDEIFSFKGSTADLSGSERVSS